MKVTNKITIHLDDPREIRPVDVMQCDAHTRELEIALFAGGKKWEIPDSVTPVISYRKPDGTKGLYDTLPNGNPACRIEANVVRAVLPPSALEAPGRVDLVLIFTDNDDNQLATFGVPVDVHRNPGVGAVASGDYFNLQKWVRDEAAQVAKVLDIHTGSEPPTNGEPIWINPDEEPEGGGAVSPEAIKQAVDDYMAGHPETDPTVPTWAKQPNKPKYTAAEVGALPADTPIPEGIPIPSSAQVGQTIVVKAVDENGKPTEWECAMIDPGFIGDCELIAFGTLSDVGSIDVYKDTNGNTFELTKAVLIINGNHSQNGMQRFLYNKKHGDGIEVECKTTYNFTVFECRKNQALKVTSYSGSAMSSIYKSTPKIVIDETGGVSLSNIINENITSVSAITWSGSSPWVAGTTYALYGVRV